MEGALDVIEATVVSGHDSDRLEDESVVEDVVSGALLCLDELRLLLGRQGGANLRRNEIRTVPARIFMT